MLTFEIMQEMWPHGDAKIPGLLRGIASASATVFNKYGLDSDLVIAHAMAQFSHECGAGLEMTENIHYTAVRACQVWPRRFRDPADCYRQVQSFAGDPEFPIKLIDNVYGHRMGNRPGTHDGSTFIGRGLSQVTGRNGYRDLGAKLGLNLIANPDLVNSSTEALESGVADFILCGCLPFARQDDVSGVTYHLNGGLTGLSERTTWLGKWKRVLGASSPVVHGTTWIQHSLNILGAEPTLVADGSFGPLTVAALKAFQASHGLEVDGRADPATLAAIEAALA
jgi:putative chitinase